MQGIPTVAATDRSATSQLFTFGSAPQVPTTPTTSSRGTKETSRATAKSKPDPKSADTDLRHLDLTAATTATPLPEDEKMDDKGLQSTSDLINAMDHFLDLTSISTPTKDITIQAFHAVGGDQVRGVIYGIDPNEDPEQLLPNLASTTHLILAARPMGKNSKTALVTFKGNRLPRRVWYHNIRWYVPTVIGLATNLTSAPTHKSSDARIADANINLPTVVVKRLPHNAETAGKLTWPPIPPVKNGEMQTSNFESRLSQSASPRTRQSQTTTTPKENTAEQSRPKSTTKRKATNLAPPPPPLTDEHFPALPQHEGSESKPSKGQGDHRVDQLADEMRKALKAPRKRTPPQHQDKPAPGRQPGRTTHIDQQQERLQSPDKQITKNQKKAVAFTSQSSHEDIRPNFTLDDITDIIRQEIKEILRTELPNMINPIVDELSPRWGSGAPLHGTLVLYSGTAMDSLAKVDALEKYKIGGKTPMLRAKLNRASAKAKLYTNTLARQEWQDYTSSFDGKPGLDKVWRTFQAMQGRKKTQTAAQNIALVLQVSEDKVYHMLAVGSAVMTASRIRGQASFLKEGDVSLALQGRIHDYTQGMSSTSWKERLEYYFETKDVAEPSKNSGSSTQGAPSEDSETTSAIARGGLKDAALVAFPDRALGAVDEAGSVLYLVDHEHAANQAEFNALLFCEKDRGAVSISLGRSSPPKGQRHRVQRFPNRGAVLGGQESPLRAEDEDSSSGAELGSGPSSVEILALNDRMSTALELVTEHLAAVTGGTGGQRQREPEELDDRKSVADFVAVLGVYARASSASDA
ncbi:hypothetical protein HPB47_014342 [Ixodes persulcatus]|uniref:Uncharacterized protein n=1 Tax=Ixodes persulcatus TaxID=34615 RepID=A0AC60QWI7_IXOPE|nr:hypothetical protein HPB47_014342 [Ixodes persulcatus]